MISEVFISLDKGWIVPLFMGDDMDVWGDQRSNFVLCNVRSIIQVIIFYNLEVYITLNFFTLGRRKLVIPQK